MLPLALHLGVIFLNHGRHVMLIVSQSAPPISHAGLEDMETLKRRVDFSMIRIRRTWLQEKQENIISIIATNILLRWIFQEYTNYQ